ncbi:phosphonoacetaldehyde hydrolase [Clostridium sp.]|jgi:phosphonoacetaldehyde hydrolase|uniref:phosphonoacetaldehyde hydrolase n=1 Tax=Clostridium sp. TaxID=1506 RepID=UPI003EEB7977
MNKIEGVIFDWAGTTVDFGCFAPVNAFIEIFKAAGIEVTMEETRIPMGILKREHIKAMLTMPRIKTLWTVKYGKDFDESDVDSLYSSFEPLLMDSLSNYTDPLPEVIDTVRWLRESGLKIGSTTGYTNSMMGIVVKEAKKKGYEPDFWITPDSTSSIGRPYPFMILKNIEALKISATFKVIKVGDTTSDIKEGLNAGVWSVGVVVGSSEMGLSFEEFINLSENEKNEAIENTEKRFLGVGADFTIKTMSELPQLVQKINRLITEGIRPNA